MERDLPAVAATPLEPLDDHLSLGPLREPKLRVMNVKFRQVRMSFADRVKLDRRVEWAATGVGMIGFILMVRACLVDCATSLICTLSVSRGDVGYSLRAQHLHELGRRQRLQARPGEQV